MNPIIVSSLDECEAFASQATGRDRERGVALYGNHLSELIEREQAAGQPLGPVHRWLLIDRAPLRIKRLLERAVSDPLAAMANDYMRPLVQFPSASMRAAINTTTTETNLWDPSLFGFVPKNSMRGGQRWELHFGGVMGTTATPTVVWTARFGTNNAAPPTGTTLGAGPTVTIGTFTAQPFTGFGKVGVRKIDVAASLAALAGTGYVVMGAAAAATVTPVAVFGGALPATIDQTIDQGIACSIIWGASSASNTLTPHYVDVLVGGD